MSKSSCNSEILVSIITVCFNSERYLHDTIRSILSQSYKNIEYIIVDGASTDGTLNVIYSNLNCIDKFISGNDLGIYDAINKGIRLSTGNIVGILNSDDFLPEPTIIEKISEEFQNSDINALYGDVVFVKPENPDRIVRYYSSKDFNPDKFRDGYMPAHPSFYVRRELFEKFGYYKTDYSIAADFELLVRFLYVNRIKYKYIEMPFVKMRTGGISTRSWKSNYILNKEIMRACKENGIKTNYINIYSKYLRKIFEYRI